MSVVAVDTMLCVRDLEQSRSFYRDVLGFDEIWAWDTIAALELAGHRFYVFTESPPTEDKLDVWLSPQAEPGRGSVILVLRVEDCRSAYEDILGRGGVFLTPPAAPPWGGRRCFLLDPDGYVIELEEPSTETG